MKNNAPRNFIFNCHRPLSVLLLGVVVPHAQVNADVPPPPPVQHQNAGFPSAQKLEQMGYNRETGVWKVQTNPTGKPTVSSGGGQIMGTQNQRVTVTDAYGNSPILQSTRTPTVAETYRSTNKTARTDTIPTPPETPKSSRTNQTPNRPCLPAPTDTVHHYPSSTANQSRSKPTEPVSQRQSRLQNPKKSA